MPFSDPEKRKEWSRNYHKEYRQRPEVKQRKKEFYNKPEVKQKRIEYQKEYGQRPEAATKRRIRKREYSRRPEVKRQSLEYRQRPETLKKREKRMKEYRKRPDVIKIAKEYSLQPRILKYHDEYRKRPETLKRNRERSLRKYGLTIEDKEKMFKNQNGKCDICKTPFYGVWGTKERRSNCFVDHDHVSGRVRALLCIRCNSNLPSNPIPVLKEMIRYITKHEIFDLMGC